MEQSETRRKTSWATIRGDKGRQDLGKADTPSNTGTHAGRQWETGRQGRGKADTPSTHLRRWTHHPTQAYMWGDKGRQDLRKADTPSNTGMRVGRQGETRPQEAHTIQQRETRSGTMGDKGRQDPRQGGHAIQQGETRRVTMGDKGRQDTR